jgi:flagellar biosynthesis regulator FlaF
MRKQGNATPSKVHNSLITESKDIEMVEMPDRELKVLILKMINDLKEDSNKLMNELRRSTQDLDEKFSKEAEILKNKQTEILEMINLINQIKNSGGGFQDGG